MLAPLLLPLALLIAPGQTPPPAGDDAAPIDGEPVQAPAASAPDASAPAQATPAAEEIEPDGGSSAPTVVILPDDAPEIRFHWELGAETCPGEGALRDAVAARLGYFPFTRDAERALYASVTRHGDQLIGHLRLEDSAGTVIGERTLEGGDTDCAELSRALQLAIAIAIDPTVITRPTPPPAEPSAPPPPEPVSSTTGATSGTVEVRPATVIEVRNTDRARKPTIPEPVEGDPEFVGPPAPPATPTPAPVGVPARYEGPAFQLSTWSGLTFATGVAPAPTFGFSAAGLGVRYKFASFMTELRHDLAQSARGTNTAAAVVASLTSVTSFVCVHSGWMYGCGSAGAGGYTFGAVGLINAVPQWRPYLAAGGRAGADLPLLAFLGRFWSLWKLRLHVDAAVPLPMWRWRLVHSTPPNDVLWEVPPVAVVLGAAIVLTLPP